MLVAPIPTELLIQTRIDAFSERDCYYAALDLVAQIDEDLQTGRRHYRNRAGQLLSSLDEVVRAILTGDLWGVCPFCSKQVGQVRGKNVCLPCLGEVHGER